MNMIGRRVLLCFSLICLPFNGVNSGFIRNSICQDDEYYDEERDVCLDDCGGLRCAVGQICSDMLDGYEGPRACKNKCYQDCDIMEFCNIKTAHCDPCSSICSDLRRCRHLCYDVYKNLSQTTSYTSMEMTAVDSTPADSTISSEGVHLNDWVIAVPFSLLVLVILALVGVTASLIHRRKNNEAKPNDESTEPMLNPTNSNIDSSITTNDFRIVMSVRLDDKIVAALCQMMESRQELATTEIRKAEIGYQLVNYLLQCNDENLETARKELANVLEEQVQDLNKLKAAARNHTIDTFKSESEEEILKWLKTGNAVRVDHSEEVESPELLMMHGHVSAEEATAIIQYSNCKCLCLFNDKSTGLNSQLVVPTHLEELHMHPYLGNVDTLKTLADVSSLRALTVVFYFTDRTKIIQELIMQMNLLQAIGFQFSHFVNKEQCNMLLASLKAKNNIKCITLYINPEMANEIDLLVDIISNVKSLQELWLSFLARPTNDDMERIAKEFRQNPKIKTIAVVGNQGPVNITPFINVEEENSNISTISRTIYTDYDTSKLPEHFTGKLVRVQSGLSSCFFTSMMYSRFLLTSIPLYIKKDLFNKYVSQSS